MGIITRTDDMNIKCGGYLATHRSSSMRPPTPTCFKCKFPPGSVRPSAVTFLPRKDVPLIIPVSQPAGLSQMLVLLVTDMTVCGVFGLSACTQIRSLRVN